MGWRGIEGNQRIRDQAGEKTDLAGLGGEAALKMIIPRHRGFSAQLAWDGVFLTGVFAGLKRSAYQNIRIQQIYRFILTISSNHRCGVSPLLITERVYQ